MKEGWETKTLEELCIFGNGLWIGKTPPFQRVGVVRNTNFTKDGRLDDSDIVYLDVEKSQFVKRKLQYGDIILEKSGGGPKQPVGRVIIFNKKDGDFSFSNFTSLIRVKDVNKIDFNYLHIYLNLLYLLGRTETMQSNSTGIRNLKLDEYKQIKLPYPPLKEQKQVVELLRRTISILDEAESNAETNLQNPKDLFECVLRIEFNKLHERDEIKKLGEVAHVKSGGTPARSKKEYWEGNIPWYSSGELNEQYTTVPSRMINEMAIQNSNAKLFPKGSLLIGMYDTAALKMSLLDRDATFNQAIAGVKPNSDIDLQYVFNAINAIKPELLNLRRGVRQKNLSLEKIKNISLVFPNIETQKKVATKLNNIASQIQKLQDIQYKKIIALDELKRSILQRAFAGELTQTNELTTA